MGEQGFQITQRADFLDEAVSSATTRSRPMVNTRDEPHADPDAFRRLHVIIGDSNRSQWATMMKLATTHLVLCVIEQAGREGKDSGFARFSFADASAANHKVSRDLTGIEASFDMADGTVVEGGAVAIQERYLEIVERFVGQHPEVCSSLPRTDVHEVIRQWRRHRGVPLGGWRNVRRQGRLACQTTAVRHAPQPCGGATLRQQVGTVGHGLP